MRDLEYELTTSVPAPVPGEDVERYLIDSRRPWEIFLRNCLGLARFYRARARGERPKDLRTEEELYRWRRLQLAQARAAAVLRFSRSRTIWTPRRTGFRGYHL